MNLGLVVQSSEWCPQLDSTFNLAHWASAKTVRLGPNKQGYAPDVSITSRTGTSAYRSWQRRVRQALINGCRIVYDSGFYPASDEGIPAEGGWAEMAGDAWTAYSEEVSGGDYRDSVPPAAVWAAGLQVDVELIGFARAQCVALGLDPDAYIIICGPNEPGAIGPKGASAFGWDFSTGEDAFVDWVNYLMPALRAEFPSAQIETPILGGIFSTTSVSTDLSSTLSALTTIASLGFNFSVYDRFAINCYISYASQAAPDADGFAVAYAHKVQSIAGKLAQLGLPSTLSINEFGVASSNMNIGFVSMTGQAMRLRKTIEQFDRLTYLERALIYKACAANSTEDGNSQGEFSLIRCGSGGTQGQWKTAVAQIVSISRTPPETANSSHANLKLSDHADMGSWASAGVAARATGYWAPSGQPSAESTAPMG